MRNACTAESTCSQVPDRLDWCQEWRDSVPRVAAAYGGQDHRGRDMGQWWTSAP